MRNRIRLFLLVAFTLTLVGCGAESSNSYTPTTDVISTTALITLNSEAVTIVTQGAPGRSLVIDSCEIASPPGTLPYSFKSNEELILGGETFEYVRPLATAVTVPNVDPRLFAVWKLPAYTNNLVTYNIEVEIHRDTIVYRNTCVR